MEKSSSRAILGRDTSSISDVPPGRNANELIIMAIVQSIREGSLIQGDEPTAIRVEDLVKTYGKVEAVREVSLELHSGEIFGLIGPDGAGKTSTFQILAGIMPATSGRTEIFGRPS